MFMFVILRQIKVPMLQKKNKIVNNTYYQDKNLPRLKIVLIILIINEIITMNDRSNWK